MYEELLKLPFPAGARATKELKQALLSKDLIRAVNTHKLVETSASGSRRTCYFPSERIEDYTKKYKWLFVGDSGAVCIYCKLFCDSKNRPQVAGVLTGKPCTALAVRKLWMSMPWKKNVHTMPQLNLPPNATMLSEKGRCQI